VSAVLWVCGVCICQVFVVSVKPWLRAWYEAKGYVAVGTQPWPVPEQLKMPCHFHRLIRNFHP
jgi:hypothetical protein